MAKNRKYRKMMAKRRNNTSQFNPNNGEPHTKKFIELRRLYRRSR